MYGLVPFSRGETVSDFQDVYDLFNRFFNASLKAPQTTGSMRCDIRENDKSYILDIELPGVKKEDIDIRLDNGYLSVSVEAKEEQKKEKRNYIIQERKYGGCQRSFKVGSHLTKDDINAQYEAGILTITIPKKEETAKSYKIDIM